jgi:hypothetical protein
MRAHLLWLFLLAGCQFGPSLGGEPLTGCTVDQDCPRGGKCVEGACAPQPLRILSLYVDPDVVEAGEVCTFHVEAIHSRKASELRYWWHQTRGPRQELVGNGTAVASLTTAADFVGSYELEVRVDNGFEPPAIARIHCNALVSEDAAFIVPNQGGDCSRLLPCSSFDDAPAVKRYYLGVVPNGAGVAFFDSSTAPAADGVEVHGGYVFPGWQRDLNRAKTTVFDPAYGYNTWTCDDCVLSGMTLVFNLAEAAYGSYILSASGTQVTLRESRFLLTATGKRDGFAMLHVATAAVDVRLEALEFSVQTAGITGTSLSGIVFAGDGGAITDSRIDLRGSDHLQKVGLSYSGSATTTVRLESVSIVTGGAANGATAYAHRCGTTYVANSIFDTRGGQSAASTAGTFTTDGYACKSAGRVYSSIFIGGDGIASNALSLDRDIDSMTFTNTIFDGGNGAKRTALDLYWLQSWGEPMSPQQFSGCVFILEGGKQQLDVWVRLADDNEMTVEAAETLLACPGCLKTATTAAQVDRDGSDFHLSEASTSCIDTGAPLDAEAPSSDRDGVPWADPPSVGPYQYVP